MKSSKLKNLMIAVVAVVATLSAASCSSSSSGPESKYESALQKVNPSWKVYEVKQEGPNTVIRVEAGDVVPFPQAKKALEALQAVDPKLVGYVEFYNKEVGMVLRKLEIVPNAPATPNTPAATPAT